MELVRDQLSAYWHKDNKKRIAILWLFSMGKKPRLLTFKVLVIYSQVALQCFVCHQSHSNHEFSGLTCFHTLIIISAWGNARVSHTTEPWGWEQRRSSVLELGHGIRARLPAKLTWLYRLISWISSLVSFKSRSRTKPEVSAQCQELG